MRKFAFIIFLAAAPQTQTQTPPQTQTPKPPTVTHIDIPPQPDRTHDYEDWHVELTGGYWALSPSGNVKTRSTPADLESDLGVDGYKSHFFARIAVKPARRHELVFEGIPYRLNGGSRLTQPVDFVGNTFPAGDELSTEIKLDSYNAEYRYRFHDSQNGFLGLIAGAGYLDGRITVDDVTRNVSESNRARVVFPYLGVAGRNFLQHNYRYNLYGEIKGMPFGNYGYYLQANGGFGFSPLQTLTLRAGYAFLASEVHNKFESEGVKAHFQGPTLSIQWRDR